MTTKLPYGLAKFFKAKKPVHIKTVYQSGSAPIKVYDDGRSGTTKIVELELHLTANGFTMINQELNTVYQSYDRTWIKDTIEIKVMEGNPAWFGSTVAWLMKS